MTYRRVTNLSTVNEIPTRNGGVYKVSREKRISDLEKHTNVGCERTVIIYIPVTATRDPSEAEKEVAIGSYLEKHGDAPVICLKWTGDFFCDL